MCAAVAADCDPACPAVKSIRNRLAVITGGGSGVGRELAYLLSLEGCSLAICDISECRMAATKKLCESANPRVDARISTHLVDVADERQVVRFAHEVGEQHQTDFIHLLFNNAAIAGGGSFIKSSRAEWDRTFNICWNGVHFTTRAFLPMLQKAEEGHVINLSSAAGFWAAASVSIPHTAYAAAKFAVKGFSESLIVDFRQNAPHLRCSVVMLGHVGTPLVENTRRVLEDGDGSDESVKRSHLAVCGFDVTEMTSAQVNEVSTRLEKDYIRFATTSARKAAEVIVAGVKADRWRIIVGEDANLLDRHVRQNPEEAYEFAFSVHFLAKMKSPLRRLRRLYLRLKEERRLQRAPGRSTAR